MSVVHLYDREQDDLGERYESGVARHCGALAGAVQSLLEMTGTEVEILAARTVAKKALNDYEVWLAKLQTSLGVGAEARGRDS